MNYCSAIMPPTKPAILTILTLSHRLRPSSQCSENSAMLEDLLLRPQLANFAIDMHTITATRRMAPGWAWTSYRLIPISTNRGLLQV